MPLPSLNLDDRRFRDLVDEAQRWIARSCPGWTDFSPGEPGTTLLELFAHLTEVMIYRLNRLPEKAYVEFLRLIGTQLFPPCAAVATLRFGLSSPLERPVEVPRGTRVAASRADAQTEAPVFVTASTATIPPGAIRVEVQAYHADLVEAELLGRGTGQPGLTLQVRRPPVVAPTGEGIDLVVGVEASAGELPSDAPARQHGGKTFRIWREVEGFRADSPGQCVYTTDRAAGLITFAQAVRLGEEEGPLADTARVLGAVPAAGREVRAWYCTGGGSAGNVAAGMLTTLKDPLPGVHLEVTNPAPASGGRPQESLENALARGPQELHSLRRAVTARDFELVAERSSGAVARARAYTLAAFWRHAAAGSVEVVLVPDVPPSAYGDGPLTPPMLHSREGEEARARVQSALDRRRPLGTRCVVSWCRYKSVQAQTRVWVHREEDPAAVRERVLKRLYDTITPLQRTPDAAPWPFGQALSAYHIYRILGAEPGVKNVDPVRLRVADVPDADVRTVVADPFQPRTWYAAAGPTLFRTLNDGDGWEGIGSFPDQRVDLVKPYPRHPGLAGAGAGLLAVATRMASGPPGSRLHLSRDCGESWEEGPRVGFTVQDMAWLQRDGVATLVLATEVGLYELAAQHDSIPVQTLVDPDDPRLGFYAVAVSTDVFGQTSVAVAARGRRGVYLSVSAGKPNTFRPIGLQEDVRVLAVQHRGPARYLWAGMEAVGDDPGKGCRRWELTAASDSPADWQEFSRDWDAGGCQGIDFLGSTVLAATSRKGVLRLDPDAREPVWDAPDVRCGLPFREFGDGARLQFVMERVQTVASEPEGRDRPAERPAPLLAGGRGGVYRSVDGGKSYAEVSRAEFTDTVTLPPTWLFCSATHEVEVVAEDDA